MRYWKKRIGRFLFSWKTLEPFAFLPGIELWHQADGYEPTLLVFRWLGFAIDITLRQVRFHSVDGEKFPAPR